MSAEEYDQAEQLFCGKWQNVGNENLDEFMASAGKILSYILCPSHETISGSIGQLVKHILDGRLWPACICFHF